jgi:flagellar biosynthesis protein FliP
MSSTCKALLTLVAAGWLALGAAAGPAVAQPAPPVITQAQIERTVSPPAAEPEAAATTGAGTATAARRAPAGAAARGQQGGGLPDVAINVDGQDGSLSRTVVVILLLTVGSVAPGLLLMMTAFTRFVVVLGLVKNALGLQTIPPSQVLIGLALFLTFFVMNPVFTEVNSEAIQPLLAGTIGQDEAMEAGFAPIRQFMLAQTRQEDLRLFVELANSPQPEDPTQVSAAVLIPAFAISELRAAFIIGFIIFIPFLVIDLVVAAVLMSMGMMMLPPVFVSLPLKLLLFVLVDGWVLIVGSLVNSVDKVLV